MTKTDFLAQLSALLVDIAPEERENAIQYYTECFDDAGPDGEAALIAELGSPKKVAAIIRANLPQSVVEQAERPRAKAVAAEEPAPKIRGLYDPDEVPAAPEPESPFGEEPQGAYSAQTEAEAPKAKPAARGNRSAHIILLVIALAFFFPLVMRIVGGVLGAVAGATGGGVAMAGGAVGRIIASLALLPTSPGLALLGVGLNLIACAVGVLLAGLSIWLIVWLVKWGIALVKRLLDGRG